MATHDRPSPNGFVTHGFVTLARKIYHPLHFNRGYNFILFVITAGAMMGLSLARLMFLNIDGIFCDRNSQRGAAPGECYYYSGEGGKRYRVGIIIHLATILPVGLLVGFQFVPVIRHKAILYHRLAGYFILALTLISMAGVFMITDKSFGGDLVTQTITGLTAIMFLASLLLAYFNVKRLQLEQHRAWMLRAWCYAGSIITLRVLLQFTGSIISKYGFYSVRSCKQIDYIFDHLQNYTVALYPGCEKFYTGESPEQRVLVAANANSDNPIEITASIGLSYGMSFLIALALHAVLVEIYLHLTPGEAERLRTVSYQRQMEVGMTKPGSAGLTSDRLGDARPWVPKDN